MKSTKKVIKRNLPLMVKYTLESISYLSIENGGGCSCDNCGKLITNIAHIKNASGSKYTIGLDCLDTLLENNTLLDHDSYVQYLFSDKPAISKAKSLRAKLMNAVKKDSTFTATLIKFDNGFGFSYSIEKVRTWKMLPDNSFIDCEPYTTRDPQGFDYRFDLQYFDLTMNYIKGLPGVIITL